MLIQLSLQTAISPKWLKSGPRTPCREHGSPCSTSCLLSGVKKHCNQSIMPPIRSDSPAPIGHGHGHGRWALTLLGALQVLWHLDKCTFIGPLRNGLGDCDIILHVALSPGGLHREAGFERMIPDVLTAFEYTLDKYPTRTDESRAVSKRHF